MSKSFTAADADRVRNAVSAAVEDLRMPGVGVGVVAGQDLVFAEGFGFADIESGRKQDPHLRQRIGSITKTMVGLSTMALVDEGRLKLTDRLADLVPEVTLHGDGAGVTVRHLLTHTSGIGEVAMPDEMRKAEASLWSDQPDKDVLGLFPNGITIDVPPGSKWSYANLAYALLGEVVARAEGAPIGEVLKRRVFDPLGMGSSDLADEPHPDLTTGYHRAPSEDARELALRGGEEIKDEPTVDGINIRGRFQHIRGGGAAGAVQSTVPDMAKYAAALLRGGAGIVKRETFAQMTADQWRPDPRMEGWGLSFQLSRPFGRRVFGHGGGVLGGWNSLLTILPDEDLALIAHANISFEDFGRFCARALAAVLDEIPHALGGHVDEAVIAAAPGVYEAIPGVLTNFRVMGGMGRLQIKAADGGLMLHSRRGPWKKGVRLFPGDVGDPAFLVADDDPLDPSRIALIRSDDGQVTGLRCERLVQMIKTADVAPWA